MFGFFDCSGVCRYSGFNANSQEEADYPSDDEDEDEDEGEEKTEPEESKESKEEDKDVKGVPAFWLTIFKNVEMLAEMVTVRLRHTWKIVVVGHWQPCVPGLQSPVSSYLITLSGD